MAEKEIAVKYVVGLSAEERQAGELLSAAGRSLGREDESASLEKFHLDMRR
jgi:hypothetical protein